MNNLPKSVQHIASRVQENKGRAFLVGGAVRDFIQHGFEPKDWDLELHGVSLETVNSILQEVGTPNAVGSSFGVLKVQDSEGNELDVALPRRENKQGQGHKGFIVEVDPTMTVEEASSRRDFTINSMMMDLNTHEIIDCHNGVEDLEAGILRHTSPAFAEDILRVLRAMNFAGRFNMSVHQDTIELCESLKSEFHTLPVERIWGEFKKWALKSRTPSKGLEVLLQTGWLEFFPELQALVGLQQEPEHHPEGDAFQHTLHAVDAAVEICERDNLTEEKRLAVVFGALCHDMGKATTTEVQESGKVTSFGHDKAGVEPAESFMNRIGAPKDLVEEVKILVAEHMVHVSGEMSARVVRRLANRISKHTTVEQVSRVMEADIWGRPPLARRHPAPELLTLAKELDLENSKPVPMLTGKHLLEMGFKPGKEMGDMLKKVFELQLDGTLADLESCKNFVMNQK